VRQNGRCPLHDTLSRVSIETVDCRFLQVPCPDASAQPALAPVAAFGRLFFAVLAQQYRQSHVQRFVDDWAPARSRRCDPQR
jgi:hypothetical protein|tara:strand:+ start:96 stop:341 length:246 start_codon:yes stop_codon:yes gene_type:complete